jgi:hypothetical protein
MPPAVPPTPSTPPPPPPEREVNSVTVTGIVLSAGGNPVPFAQVEVAPTDSSCRTVGTAIGAVADASGEFMASVEGPVGPAYQGCVIVSAQSGGSRGTTTVPAYFTPSKEQRVATRAEVRLDPPAPLDVATARRLAEGLVEAINEPSSSAAGELAFYVNDGGEALRVALEQYRQHLGRVVSLREVPAEEWYRSSRHVSFELVGENGRTSRLNVHQEAFTRLQSLLLNYGYRTEGFMHAYLRAISSGDADRLARVLNPDDVDFPVERAREIVIGYRQRFDTATLRAEFVSADEARGQFTWRIRGQTPSGAELTETVVLQTGDGLVGVVSVDGKEIR